MPLDAKSYIARESDSELRTAVERCDFVWIHGDFQYGKTSLLHRHRSWLSQDWTVASPDLALCNTMTDRAFWRDFFAELGEALAGRNREPCPQVCVDWRSLRLLLCQSRIAFLLDEIGSCKPNQVRQLVEKINALSETQPGKVKLVICYSGKPHPFLPSCGLHNPRHTNSWEIITLRAFTAIEVETLIARFPHDLAAMLLSRIAEIESLTAFEPNRVQRLLHAIWENLRTADYRGVSRRNHLNACLANLSRS